jgi:hypothetical protein
VLVCAILAQKVKILHQKWATLMAYNSSKNTIELMEVVALQAS